ncbi:MAG: TerC family protein [Halopseudomonas aestusnigri]
MENLIALAYEPAAWMALFTLVVMEIVLGIDNLIFVSILTNKLPEERRSKARNIGLGLALVFRLALLGTVAVIVQLVEPVVSLFELSFSWRDIILISGGLFLVWKATKEIHHNVENDEAEVQNDNGVVTSFATTIGQIIVLDLVFSIDSIVTAVGMTDHISIMVIAVISAVLVMLLAAGPLSRFIEANPTIVMLALGFLMMIGMTLIADGFGVHVPKGYIYAAMTFSAFVEALNMLTRKRKIKAG